MIVVKVVVKVVDKVVDMGLTCKRCLRIFSRKEYLVKHLKSDIVCIVHQNGVNVTYDEILKTMQRPEYKYICKNCSKSFKTYDLKYRHEKFNCREFTESVQQNKTKYESPQILGNSVANSSQSAMQESAIHLEQAENDIRPDVAILYEELKRLESKIDQLVSNPPVTNNSNCHNNINTNNTINIININICTPNNFGTENIHHVVNDKEFMRQCLQTLQSSGIIDLVSKLHFNTEFPENQNGK